MSAPQLFSLKFRNTSFTSSMMAIDLEALNQPVNFLDTFIVESRPEFDEGFDFEHD